MSGSPLLLHKVVKENVIHFEGDFYSETHYMSAITTYDAGNFYKHTHTHRVKTLTKTKHIHGSLSLFCGQVSMVMNTEHKVLGYDRHEQREPT
jgi:hypothetical protein